MKKARLTVHLPSFFCKAHEHEPNEGKEVSSTRKREEVDERWDPLETKSRECSLKQDRTVHERRSRGTDELICCFDDEEGGMN